MIKHIRQRVLASFRIEADSKYSALTAQIKHLLTVEGKRRKKQLDLARLNGAVDSVFLLLKQKKFLGAVGMKKANADLLGSKPVSADKLESVVGRLAAIRIVEAVNQALMVR